MKQKIFFPNLDGLRFLCFLSVFFYHSFYTEYSYISGAPFYRFVKYHLLENANIGVNFFFVLSGFLITYLLLEEKRTTLTIRINRFYERRILRIWPLYFFCVFFGFVIFPWLKKMAGQIPMETANPFFYLTLINNFDVLKEGLPDASILGVLWSIAIEEQYYLVWPLFIAAFPPRHLPKVFAIIIIDTFIFRAMNDSFGMHEMHTLSCIGDMTIGACGAYFVQMSNGKEIIAKLSRKTIILIYILFVAIYFFRHDLLFVNYYTRIFERAILAVVILLIILEQCYARNSFFKMSSFQRISKLGTITYGLYCLHFIAILVVLTISRKANFGTGLWQVMVGETLFALVISIIFGKISYRYFEKPFLKLKESRDILRSKVFPNSVA
jgi:peptidoglycan/LPS O-acetylase OafA/YrhL